VQKERNCNFGVGRTIYESAITAPFGSNTFQLINLDKVKNDRKLRAIPIQFIYAKIKTTCVWLLLI